MVTGTVLVHVTETRTVTETGRHLVQCGTGMVPNGIASGMVRERGRYDTVWGQYDTVWGRYDTVWGRYDTVRSPTPCPPGQPQYGIPLLNLACSGIRWSPGPCMSMRMSACHARHKAWHCSADCWLPTMKYDGTPGPCGAVPVLRLGAVCRKALQTSCTETARHYAYRCPHSNAASDLPPNANTTAKIWVTRRPPCVMLARRAAKTTISPAIPRSHPTPISPPICQLQDRNPSTGIQPISHIRQQLQQQRGGPRGSKHPSSAPL